MINFQRLTLAQKSEYDRILRESTPRGCEYSFANQFLWGQQQVAFFDDCIAFFAHFGGRSVYPYPIGSGDRKAVIQAIMADARERGIPLRIFSMTNADKAELEGWFPGEFQFHTDRDAFDYVYTADSLADLRGRKFQKKRNHFNRFQAEHPNFQVQKLDDSNLSTALGMVEEWFCTHQKEDPHGNFLLERLALSRAFRNYDALQMEGILLLDEGRVLAVTMGSRLSEDTFDIHFEKALEDVEGAYNAVNCAFARYLRGKYPAVCYLNREDDMGLDGLRKAKLSYNPVCMVEKFWAYLPEEFYAD